MRLYDVRQTVLHCSGHGLRAGRYIEFGENAFDMEAYGPLGNSHDLSDLAVCFAVFDLIEDIHLAQGQLFHAVVRRLGVLGRGAQQRQMNMIPEIFDEGHVVRSIDAVGGGE